MAEKIAAEKSELFLEPSKASATRDYIFETLFDATINTSNNASKVVNVGGFRKFSIMARFEGQPSSKIRFEIGQNKLTLAQEIFNIGTGGWYNFSKVYDVFAPNIGVAIYEFPPNVKVRMYIYAGY